MCEQWTRTQNEDVGRLVGVGNGNRVIGNTHFIQSHTERVSINLTRLLNQ
jgi:hypothetical protein